MNMFKDPCTLSDAYLLQLFNLQRENVETIDIAHKPDGLYATIQLIKETQECPVCGFTTSTDKGLYVQEDRPFTYHTYILFHQL